MNKIPAESFLTANMADLRKVEKILMKNIADYPTPWDNMMRDDTHHKGYKKELERIQAGIKELLNSDEEARIPK